MGKSKLFAVMLPITLLALFSVSCIQDEPLNAECDILSAELDGKNLLQQPLIENNRITFVVADTTTNMNLKLKNVRLTIGATIEPSPNIEQDFSYPIIYTVTSEDRMWHKNYTISVVSGEINTNFSFEDYETTYSVVFGKEIENYDRFFEYVNGVKKYIWASGNPGFKLSNIFAKPDQYPTSAAAGEGCNSEGIPDTGSIAAKLVTRSTGPFGEGIGMPIATGSLYLGTFDVKSATSDPLGATQFGIPFNSKPIKLTGYYHYTPGAVFIGGDADTKDELDIYAVLYKPTAAIPMLDGSNILTSDQIIAKAQLAKPESGWPITYTQFEIDFSYTDTYDQSIADNYGYNFTIVFSSSKNGASFQGAVGSTLYIDEVKLTTDKDTIE